MADESLSEVWKDILPAPFPKWRVIISHPTPKNQDKGCLRYIGAFMDVEPGKAGGYFKSEQEAIENARWNGNANHYFEFRAVLSKSTTKYALLEELQPREAAIYLKVPPSERNDT